MCNNCIHKAVCSIYRATGGVKKCEHHREERRGRWKKEVEGGVYWYACSECGEEIAKTRWKHDLYSDFCPHCGADMRGAEDGK